MSRVCLVIVALIAVSLAARVTPEPKPHATNGWKKTRRTSPLARMSIHFALKRDFSPLYDELYAVSQPSSPRYGQLYTAAQVRAATAPSEATLAAIKAFSQKHRLECRLVPGQADWLECGRVPVRKVEQLFEARFHDYTHSDAPGVVLPRSASYTLPSELAEHVDLVAGMKRLPDMRRMRPRTHKARADDQGVTPQRSRELWHVGETRGSPSNGNKQSVVQFLKQYFSLSDLNTFWSDLNLPNVSVTLSGPEGPAGTEAMLDLETVTGVNQGTATLGVSNGGLGPDKQEPFLRWLLSVAGQADPSMLHSVSYGDVEASIDAAYLTRVDQEFVKLGLLGHTFVYSSGDSGVGCSGGVQQPDFPASSPHVLSVGGVVDNGSPNPDAWNGSGGGFSDFFAEPSFMRAVHQDYLQNAPSLPPSNIFNQTGRGYPDVAAVAWDVVIVVGGQEGKVGGTSCASPQIAALIAMLNDIRIGQSKSPLGYITPLMYNVTAEAFVSITTGGPNSASDCQGFTPRSSGGWSPIVGFGGLNFAKLAQIVQNLP